MAYNLPPVPPNPEGRALYEWLNEVYKRNNDIIELGSSHTLLADIGTNTHAQIDTHVADASIHTEDNLLVHLAGTETVTGTKTFSEIIASSKGISFPATQVASADPNTLDDYEEGTWTVELYDAASGGNVSSSTTTGDYTKTGGRVTCSFGPLNNIDTTGMTAGTQLYISLPFTAGVRSVGSVVTSDIDYPSTTRTQANSVVGVSGARASIRCSGDGVTGITLLISGITSGASDLYSFTLTFQV